MRIPNNGLTRYLLFNATCPIKLHPHGTHVDLGAGHFPRNPAGATNLVATDFLSVDEPEGSNFSRVQSDLTKKLPFADSSVDSVSCFDVLEHIPRWERTEKGIEFPFINLMSEISRILNPGGIFIAVTPAFPRSPAFQDPTHVNFISEGTIDYFVGTNPPANSLGYGFSGDFTKIHVSWLKGPGPYEETSWVGFGLTELQNLRTLKFSPFELLRFAVRIQRILRKRNPSHLLWVLRKS